MESNGSLSEKDDGSDPVPKAVPPEQEPPEQEPPEQEPPEQEPPEQEPPEQEPPEQEPPEQEPESAASAATGSPLFVAVSRGAVDEVAHLLRRSEQISDDVLDTGKLKQMRLIWDDGLKRWRKRWDDLPAWIPLAMACRLGYDHCAKLLLSSVDEETKMQQLKARDKDGYTALRLAAQWGHKSCVDLMVDAIADVNSRDNWGETPLMWASAGGWDWSVQERVDAGEDLVWNRTSYPGIVQSLLQAKARVGDADDRNCTALMHSARTGFVETMKLLTHELKPQDIDRKDSDRGWDALMYAICAENADVDLKDNPQRLSSSECVLELIESSADLTSTANKDALAEARSEGNYEIIDILLHHGAPLELLPEQFDSVQSRNDAGASADRTYLWQLQGDVLRSAFYHLESGEPTPLAFWAATVIHPVLVHLLEQAGTDQIPLQFFTTQDATSSSRDRGWTIGHRLADAGSKKCLDLMLKTGLKLEAIVDATGTSVLDLARQNSHLHDWAARIGAYAGRWQLTAGLPKYQSSGSVVYEAFDLNLSRTVAIKVIYDKACWEKEVWSREQLGELCTAVPSILAAEQISHSHAIERRLRLPETAIVHVKGQDEWAIAMPLASRSLFDAIAAERVAGIDIQFVTRTSRDLLQCLCSIHQAEIIHADIKPRNACRFVDHFKLIDFDCATALGAPVQTKVEPGFCSAYAPPELAAHLLLCDAKDIPSADTSFDVWSFGVVLYELCSGVKLFHSTLVADQIVGDISKVELLNWRGIDARRLDLVFAECASLLDGRILTAAKDLIQWCLLGAPAQRPSVEQVLQHDFFVQHEQTNGGASTNSRHPQHFFLSHFQKEAADLVRSLYMMFRDNGCSCWLDMEEEDLTLNGMREGVEHSECFVLILTRGVMFRPYCIEEIHHAFVHKNKVQLIVEEDPKFDKFDFDEWQMQWNESNSDYEWCVSTLADMEGGRGRDAASLMMASAANLIFQNWERAIPFRRRNYESKGMMVEILGRNGLYTQKDLINSGLVRSQSSSWMEMSRPVHLVYATEDSAVTKLIDDFKTTVGVASTPQNFCGHEWLVFVLRDGALSAKKYVDTLHEALSHGYMFQVVYTDWSFGSKEQAEATKLYPTIGVMFSQLELICYRDEPYERKALVNEVLRRLAVDTRRSNQVLNKDSATPSECTD